MALIEDIKMIIYSYVDIETLKSLCVVDKESLKICSSKYFWDIYFYNNNLVISIKKYYKCSDWFNEFIKVHYAVNYSLYIIDNVKYPSFYIFNINCNIKHLMINNDYHDRTVIHFVNNMYNGFLKGGFSLSFKNIWSIYYMYYEDLEHEILIDYIKILLSKTNFSKYLYNLLYNGIKIYV